MGTVRRAKMTASKSVYFRPGVELLQLIMHRQGKMNENCSKISNSLQLEETCIFTPSSASSATIISRN